MLNLKALEQFEQSVLFERFYDEPDFFVKKMFGGLAIYYRGLMVACLMEGDLDDMSYRGKKYKYPIWRGLLMPTYYEHHETLLADLKGALSHPVLGKWLYLPLDSDHFDTTSRKFIVLLAKGDSRLGIVPSSKSRKKK
jgi:hypothetical protein